MSDTVNSCTNPGTIRVFTQRAQLKRWQASPRFKAMKRDHALKPGAVCAHCGRQHGEQRYERNGDPKLTPKGKPSLTSLTINHMSETLYLTEDLYLTYDPALMEVCCSVCNGWDRQGKEVCPVCRVNPIKKDDPQRMCVACYLDAHPEIKKEIQEKREAREEGKRLYKKGQAEKRKKDKVKHTCNFRRIEQGCSAQMGKKCTFAPTKAKNCILFKAKVRHTHEFKWMKPACFGRHDASCDTRCAWVVRKRCVDSLRSEQP